MNALPSSPIEIGPLHAERIGHLKTLESMGVACYPTRFERNVCAAEIQHCQDLPQNDIGTLLSGAETGPSVAIAGRMVQFRTHGKIAFADLQDHSGKIQLAFSDGDFSIDTGRGASVKEFSTENGPVSAFECLSKLIDIGDIVGVRGTPFVTKRGEKTVLVREFQLLSKSIAPLPNKHEGLKDVETRFRKRYLDMLNPEIHSLLERRSRYFSSMRRFLEDRGFLELDTPRLENTTGGADAKPFQTHYNAFDSEVFLRISAGELWQKRLMVGGFEKTFEIGPVWRNEGISPEHAQDYMQMEVYWAYADYHDMMDLVRDMYITVVDATYGRRKFSINGHEVDFDKQWQVIDYAAVIRETMGVDIFLTPTSEIEDKLRSLKVKFEAGNRQRLIDLLWKQIRKTISGPAFLVNEPKFMSPLAKSKLDDVEITERFHVILAGSEVGNGYSELNDPIDQLERFQAQQSLRDAGDDEAQMADYEFVEALMHGMPPTAGFGVSERLFAFLEGKSIRECQTFPYVKPGA